MASPFLWPAVRQRTGCEKMQRECAMVRLDGPFVRFGGGELPPEKRTALAAVDSLASDIAQMFKQPVTYSELALDEKRSAELLAGVLQRAGFRVERAVAGMPTAFTATYGEGKPILGILRRV